MRPTSLPLRCLLFLALSTAGPLALQAQVGSERGPQLRPAAAAAAGPARVIVRFKAEAQRKQALAVGARGELRHAAVLGARHGLALADGRSVDGRTQVVVAPGQDADALAATLAADDEVEGAWVDRKRQALAQPNDPFFGSAPAPVVGQWYLRRPDPTQIGAIDAEGAWNITTGSSALVVAVIDTGVRTEHPDLAGKLLGGFDFIGEDQELAGTSFNTAGDGDGWDDNPADPGDFDGGAASSWHGTQTSGLVGAATNNGVGMAGVGWATRVLPVRALGRGGGYDSDILAAMRWSAGLAVPGVAVNGTPAKVLNMSLGSAGSCGPYQAVVDEVMAAGTVVVAAAGNDGLAVNSPANCNGVVAVAGIRHMGTKVGYSSLGPQVALAAPAGNCVNESSALPCLYPLLTTSNSGSTTPGTSIYTGDGRNASIGTSFSSPLVAGTVALMAAVQPSITPADVRRVLQIAARPFPTSSDTAGVPVCKAPSSTPQKTECMCTTATCGAGMLDARASVEIAQRGVQAVVSLPAAASVGSGATLSGTGSFVLAGRTAGYQWTVLDPAGAAVALGGATQPQVSFTPQVAGDYEVTLAVTDGTQTSTVRRVLSVAGQNVGGSGSGGGGGGALHAGWLLALLAAVAALRRART